MIELKNLAVDLGGQSVLRDINLTLMPGQITVILGRSGSGLSVLLKTAAGLIPPSSGQVLYDGCSLDSLGEQEKRRIQTRTGFMFQDAALWANMSLAANLHLPLQAKFPDLDEEARRKKIEVALQRCGLSVDLDRRPVELSVGQQKFLSFLRAVIPGPEALLLDEPIAWMDRRWAEIVIRELTEQRAKGTTLALGSHDSETSFDMADRLVVLHQGRVLAEGTRDDVRRSAHPEIREILHGRTGSDEVPPQ